jgi:hypothetical protein
MAFWKKSWWVCQINCDTPGTHRLCAVQLLFLWTKPIFWHCL